MKVGILGVDSLSILFNHRSFQKPIAEKIRIPGFRMEMEVSPRSIGGRTSRTTYKMATVGSGRCS